MAEATLVLSYTCGGKLHEETLELPERKIEDNGDALGALVSSTLFAGMQSYADTVAPTPCGYFADIFALYDSVLDEFKAEIAGSVNLYWQDNGEVCDYPVLAAFDEAIEEERGGDFSYLSRIVGLVENSVLRFFEVGVWHLEPNGAGKMKLCFGLAEDGSPDGWTIDPYDECFDLAAWLEKFNSWAAVMSADDSAEFGHWAEVYAGVHMPDIAPVLAKCPLAPLGADTSRAELQRRLEEYAKHAK